MRTAFLLALMLALNAVANTITLAWNDSPSITNTYPVTNVYLNGTYQSWTNTVGYALWMGPTSSNYTTNWFVGTNTTFTISNLPPQNRYYFTVNAILYTGTGNNPDTSVSFGYANEVNYLYSQNLPTALFIYTP